MTASTKSAPHRSGDQARAHAVATDELLPQRSPLPTGAETRGLQSPRAGLCRLNEVRSPQERRQPGVDAQHGTAPASTKSAPHRSGDSGCHGRGRRGGPRLNEVRSPQERRRPPDRIHGPATEPQRSPLPTGAETSARSHTWSRHGASTKSAPHRSGDSTSDYSPLTWADATVGEPWAQEASVERHAYRPRPMNRGLTSPFLMRRLAGFRTSTEPSRRSLARFR